MPQARAISPPMSPDSSVGEGATVTTRLSLPPRPRSKSPPRPSPVANSNSPLTKNIPPRHTMANGSTALPFRPSENLRSLQRALDHQILRYGKNHGKVAMVYNQIGNHHFRQGDLDAAKEAYNNAANCDAAGEHRVAAYTNVATVLWRTGEVAQAIVILKQALVVNEVEMNKTGVKMEESTTAASIHHQLGLCHALSSQFEMALDELASARDIRKRVFAYADIGKTIDAMGKVQSMKGDFEAAIQHHQDALLCLKAAKAPIQSTLANLAAAYEKAGKPDEAVRCQEEIQAIKPIR